MKLIFLKSNTIFSIILFSQFSYSDLEMLTDKNLSDVDGAGIGIVLEDFIFNGGEAINGGGTFEVSGLQTSDNKPVILGISQFYIAGSGSNRGTNVDGNSVNIGRLTNPFNLELRDGNDLDVGVTDKAVFEFSAPTKLNGSRASERPDMGIRFDLEIDGVSHQSLENHIESLSIDGSYIRLWGGDGHMEGELALNVYTPNIELFACDSAGLNCGETVSFQNVSIELELGQGEYQPVTFEVDATGNFVFEVGTLEGKCASTNGTGGCDSGTAGYEDLNNYYASGPASNTYIGNVSVGGQSFGSTTISNLQIQYLEVKSHDL
ncbi:hypothetical protein A9R00_05590 [Oleispira antarctica]|uniref:Uncharacterized protein n=1 Tax=Oleispira antarctica TaxID=188908 RepID=A0A1Y5I0F6_OLEAN|nr:hypothetical protein A9R00_05590 [Oleispira antarctica]